MSESEPRSEVMRLRRQICLEYEAAQQALYGLAQGTSQHAFITHRLENIAAHHAALKELLGEEAIEVLAEALEQAGNEGP